MFKYATSKNRKRKSLLKIKNNKNYTALNLAAKLGRKELFEAILEIRNIVSLY